MFVQFVPRTYAKLCGPDTRWTEKQNAAVIVLYLTQGSKASKYYAGKLACSSNTLSLISYF